MGFISTPSPIELLVILGIALIVLGPKRLPEAARSVGRGMREFKETLQGSTNYDDDDDPDEDRSEAKPVP
jgi:sec-independent protein translocase protein TatA